MSEHSTPRQVHLEGHASTVLPEGVGTLVACTSGCVWLTQHGDSRDIILHAGDSFRIERPGCVVMAGGIDMHTHIGGGKVNIARMMLPEEHRDHVQPRQHGCRSGSGHYSPSTFTTGYAYARMGYTMAFEPAMLPINARQAHQEMADVPLLDKGAYVLLGNDDLFLKLVSEGAGADAIRDYVAWTLHATQALAVKIVNPGGMSMGTVQSLSA